MSLTNEYVKLTYLDEIERNKKVLDMLDIDPPQDGEEIEEYKERLRGKLFEELGIELPDFMEGELFNYMDDYDIQNYVKERFGGKARTVEKIYFYGCGRENKMTKEQYDKATEILKKINNLELLKDLMRMKWTEISEDNTRKRLALEWLDGKVNDKIRKAVTEIAEDEIANLKEEMKRM